LYLAEVEYRIEKLSAQNIHHLVPLYQAAFDQSVSLQFLLKKYNTRPFGVEFIGFIAFASNGIAAAYYGVIPCFFKLDGKTVLAAQSADTMTHPDHRKQGLFQRLAAKTYDLAREQNIQFIFGFPNQNSLPGFIKLNWQFLPDQLQVFTLRATGFAYARLLKKLPLLSAFYEIIVSQLLGEKQIDQSFFENKNEDGVSHDNTFIAYKTYNTTHVAAINTVKVWVKADGKLKVGAIHGLHKTSAEDFLRRLKKLATKLGCRDVIFMTSKNSSLYQILINAVTPKDAFSIGFLPLQAGSFSFENVLFEYCDVDISKSRIA